MMTILFMFFMLIGAVAVELAIVFSIKRLFFLFVMYPFLGVLASIGLSALAGAVFGAGGAIVMSSSFLSTALTSLVYGYHAFRLRRHLIRRLKKHGIITKIRQFRLRRHHVWWYVNNRKKVFLEYPVQEFGEQSDWYPA